VHRSQGLKQKAKNKKFEWLEVWFFVDKT